jgi:16S rRNA processing protein RimM
VPGECHRHPGAEALCAGDSGISGEFITLARVLKTQGRRGEVAVEPHTDVANRFHEGMALWALGADGSRRALQIEELWPHKSYLVLKFAEVDSISDAESLLRCELQVPAEQRAQLEPGWTFVSDLVGCVVFDGDREVGQVRDVQFGAGEAPLLLLKAEGRQFEVPYAAAYLRNVDLERRQIRMVLPEGLLEVNAPLTDQEKQQQGGTRKERRRR